MVFEHSAAFQQQIDAQRVPCDLGCGVAYRWSDRADHLRLCPQARIACPFAGCDFAAPEPDVDLHALSCPRGRTLRLVRAVLALCLCFESYLQS